MDEASNILDTLQKDGSLTKVNYSDFQIGPRKTDQFLETNRRHSY